MLLDSPDANGGTRMHRELSRMSYGRIAIWRTPLKRLVLGGMSIVVVRVPLIDSCQVGELTGSLSAPVSLHEVALELVQAGFHPAKLPTLWLKVRYIVDLTIKSAIEKFRIPLPEGKAVEAFVIPGMYHGVFGILSGFAYYFVQILSGF